MERAKKFRDIVAVRDGGDIARSSSLNYHKVTFFSGQDDQ